MGLFSKKNANEAAYVGGKKHWTDVIKNSGSGEYLIWRQPEEDFNTNSTLIVMPGEEAVFINGGTIVQTFENGTYKLTTENYPFISRLRNAFSGGVSTFNCVVYFVRKAVSKELLWGTLDRISVSDKQWGIKTSLGARGAYKLRVDNPGKFLEKMVGNNIPYQKQEEVIQYFGEELQSKIVSTLSEFLNEWPGELIGLESHVKELSDTILPRVDDMLRDYGLKCESFSISGLTVDTSKYDRIDDSQMELIRRQREAQAEKVAKLINAEADAGVFALLGDNWAKLQSADILKTLAANTGAGGAAATGAGIGMGMASAGVFGNLANQMFSSYSGSGQQKQDFTASSSGRFVQAGTNAGTSPDPVPDTTQDDDSRRKLLRELKQLLDEGLLPKDVYDEKVREVTSRM